MIYTGTIKRFQISDNEYEGDVKISMWVILNGNQTVFIEEHGTLQQLSQRFDLELRPDCVVLENLIGKKCTIKKEEDTFLFHSYGKNSLL